MRRFTQMTRERDGAHVMRIASLRNHERYVVEPSPGDALLSTLIWGHQASLDDLRNRPRPPVSAYFRPSGDLARLSWLCYGLQEDGTSSPTLQKSAATVLVRPRSGRRRRYGGPGFASDFQVLCAKVTDAQRHLRKTIREAAENGWEVSTFRAGPP